MQCGVVGEHTQLNQLIPHVIWLAIDGTLHQLIEHAVKLLDCATGMQVAWQSEVMLDGEQAHDIAHELSSEVRALVCE